MQKFVSIDEVDFIVGGTCSSTTLAAAPIANQNKTVMISAVSSAPSISEAGEYVFRTSISDVLRSEVGAKLAFDLGKRRMAVFTDISNDAFVELAKGAKEYFAGVGGEIVAEEEVLTNSETDFQTVLSKIREANPDFLMLLLGPTQIGLFAKQAREMDLNIQLIVPLETAEDKQVIEIAGDTVEGLLYIMPGNPPETPRYQELKNKYKEKYTEEADLPYLTEAYDAAMLGVKAVLASDGSREDICDKLFEVSKTYEGISGNIEFDENGDVVKETLIKTIQNGEFVVYTPNE